MNRPAMLLLGAPYVARRRDMPLGNATRELLHTGPSPPAAGGDDMTMTSSQKERDRQLLARIREGMEVVDSDGTRIGTVARIEGGHLKIVRSDQKPRNAHQFVRPELIRSVDERVRLGLTWDELRRLWADDEFNKHHNLRPHI